MTKKRIIEAISSRLTGCPFHYRRGDRVRVIHHDSHPDFYPNELMGKAGTIVNSRNPRDMDVAVEFDEPLPGILHSCHKQTGDYRGQYLWYVPRENLHIILNE